VLFLAVRQNLFSTRERKYQHRHEIGAGNYQQDTQDDFRAAVFSNYQ
jgi:hypothetical protein